MADDIVQAIANTRVDATSLEKVVNGDENTQVTTRLGESYPTVKKAIKLMTHAGVGFTPFESKNLMIASSLANGTYAIVTNDTPQNSGLHLKKSGAWSKVTWDIDERQKTYTDTAKQDAISSVDTMIVDYDKSTDAVAINSDKNYPFKPLVRNGITSAKDAISDTDSLKLFLDAAVLNAEQGFYYSVAYYRNGLTGDGKSPNGWIITKHTKATYATASDSVEIIDAETDQTPLVRDGSIQTIFLTSPNNPEIIKLTVDTKYLAASGGFYAWNTNLRPLWSWVIDENTYVYPDYSLKNQVVKLGSDDTMTINSGKNYPFKPLVRDGITSSKDAVGDTKSLEMFLDAAVMNAEKGFYYAVSYYRNGLTTGGKSGDAWMITKHTKSTYATASDEVQIMTTSDDQTPLVRDGSIQTIFLISPTNPEIVKLTIDTSKLNPAGSFYAWNNNLRPLWSWIIDENTYTLRGGADAIAPVKIPESGLYVTLDAGVLKVAHNGGTHDYRTTIKPNGYNALPNIAQIDKKTVASTSWLWLTGGDTDWLPPLRATVVSGDAGGSDITTGGNHGKNGGAGGGQTARNIYYSTEIDGKKQTAFDGFASTIKVTIVNEVLAMNTFTTDRYAVREAFVIDVNQYGVMTVSCDRRALEPLTISRDRGLQAMINAFNASVLFLEGSVNARAAVIEGGGSGLKSAAPTAHTAIFHGAALDQLTMSVDKNYGIGDGSKVATTEQLFVTSNNTTSRKAYTAIIMGTDMVLAKGEGYQWRSSYQIKAIAAKPTGADSQLDTVNNRIIAYDANDYMLV
ncbi:hypothetical protein ACT3S4_04455 [Psychrobacter sp. AOP30-A2-5]|uniref:hypothetical protein n=1 Tax=Psychrobacter sp. AOP30-A2-5 TaxID=3457697 RepID=UPI004035F0F6